MSAEQKNKLDILKYMISGTLIVLVATIAVLIVRLPIIANDRYEASILALDKEYQEKLEKGKEDIYAELLGLPSEDEENGENSSENEGSGSGEGDTSTGTTQNPQELQKQLEDGKKEILKKYNALKSKIEKQENYYEYYTKDNHKNTDEGRDYHYYGQFYEMFNNVYSADVIFIGSSRSVYGINPRILEQNDALDEYSFYNFSLNAAGPSYYLEWYNVFKNEAKYPTPDTVIYCVDWFMFDSGNWMWRDMSYDTVRGRALYEIRQYMNTSTTSLSSTVTVLQALEETEIAEITAEQEQPEIEEPTVTPNENTTATTPTNFGEFLTNWWESFITKDPYQRLVDWWNGNERFNLAFISEGLNKYVQPFSGQNDIPDAFSNFFSLEFVTQSKYIEREAELAASNRRELRTYRTELEAELNSILGGDPSIDDGETDPDDGDVTTSPSGGENAPTDVIDVAAELKKFEDEQKAAILKKYYTQKSFRKDKDGNISSKFYKGFIPWEYEYHHQGNKTQFHEITKSEVQKVKGLSKSQVEAFKDLVKQMQADGITVVLVQIPDYAELRPDDQIAEYTALLNDLAKELGVEFYDYNNSSSEVGNSVAKSKKYFSNWNHMNESGANRFTKAFGEDLVNILK